MALVQVEVAGVPTLFSTREDGLAIVSAFGLSLTFQFQAQIVHVDEEVFDDDTGELTDTVRLLFTVNEEGRVWLLKFGRYRAYGLTDSVMGVSIALLLLKESSTCTVNLFLPN